ncbi:MAG: hypothetical protein GC171_09760 [Terrimonas sp.]|nr:hypothetical protein [Terrimonas sp.]
MQKIITLLLFSGIVLISCQSSRNRMTVKEQFDRLENVFEVANWQKITGKDTVYQYFSRMGDELFHVYQYSIEKGDSASSHLSFIRQNGGKIQWSLEDGSFELSSVDSTSSKWIDGKGSPAFAYKKISDSLITFTREGQPEILMRKTLPLATFLVRSRYDFINGTHTVDSALVPGKDKDHK